MSYETTPRCPYQGSIQGAPQLVRRSQFFVTAAERYLGELDSTSLTWEIDEAVSRSDYPKDPKEIACVGLARLAQLTADDTW